MKRAFRFVAPYAVARGFAFACALVVASPKGAYAAGLYFSDTGVRPMGRAGAFVAGADDLGAIWYNPAGLADAGTSMLIDASWLHFSVDYTRHLRILDADSTYRDVMSPTVSGSSPVLPIPTLGASYNFGPKKEWTVAGGVHAPYVALATYPDTVDGQPSPARYALGSFDGSALAVPGAYIAWHPHPMIRVGLGLEALVGVFQSQVVFSASPQDRLLGAPEQPEFDAKSRMRVGPIFAPTASGGVIFEPERHVRVGASLQLPMLVDSPATIQVRLPTDTAFDGASVSGSDAHVRFELPMVARLGVEVRPIPELRAEIAYVREFWTTHHAIDAVPDGVYITGVSGLPAKVRVPNISYPREYENSNSFRLGAEYTFKIAGYTWDARAGVSYETSAVPPGYLSLQSLDFDKVAVTFGPSVHIGQHWRFDAVYAHYFCSSVTVDPSDAKIPRVNPLKGNAPLEPVNGGDYHATADLLGVGMEYRF